MPTLAHSKTVVSEGNRKASPPNRTLNPFKGFAAPTSNTTYTPNQFFDVCIPHSSRGVVRLVAYMIRKTLGWCDSEGNPQESQVLISYQDLVTHAGISRDMIRPVLHEAIRMNFIVCVRPGRPKTFMDSGETALYELRWDSSGEYVKDPKRFQGFFDGEGNRTDIPNEFFDRLIPNEPMGVIKVVGSIIRLSIGFQARRGSRRQQVQLSYRHIQRYARIRSRSTLSESLRIALGRNYVVRLHEGYFDPSAGRESEAAIYAIKWADSHEIETIGQKSEPAVDPAFGEDPSENWTGNGRKIAPENRSENRADIEMKLINETSKQHPERDDAVTDAYPLLQEQGFDSRTALRLAKKFPKKVIMDQIRWLPLRAPRRNPAGMLRLAIEENWPEPAKASSEFDRPGAKFAANFYSGLAGLEGEPIAEPSAAEVALGEKYLARLATLTRDIEPSDFGREFGRSIREHTPKYELLRVSLAKALRSHGGSFYLRQQAKLKAISADRIKSAREAHETRFRPQWLEYLRSEEERVKKDEPASYAEFERSRETEKNRIAQSKWKFGLERSLARFLSEERQLLDFQRFMATSVLDFWKWDESMNPNRFDELSIQL